MVIGAAFAGYRALRPSRCMTRHVPITTKIVFNREIAQIFQKKCFQCHTDGNVSVPLTTYREAAPVGGGDQGRDSREAACRPGARPAATVISRTT